MKPISELHSMLLTHRDLSHRGISNNRIYRAAQQGASVRLRSGVYVTADDWQDASTREKYALEVLALGSFTPSTVFSHQSAALLHGLWLIDNSPQKIHVYCPEKSRGSLRMVCKHPRSNIDRVQEVHALGLKVTNIETTVVDCAKTLPLIAAVAVADSALHERKIGFKQLQSALRDTRGHGRKKAWYVSEVMSSLAESPGETGTRLLLSETGVRFIEQYEIVIGGHRLRVDFFLPDYNLIIEFDGDVKYTDFGPADRVIIAERNREKQLMNAGFHILRTRWHEVFVRPQLFRANLERKVAQLSHP